MKPSPAAKRLLDLWLSGRTHPPSQQRYAEFEAFVAAIEREAVDVERAWWVKRHVLSHLSSGVGRMAYREVARRAKEYLDENPERTRALLEGKTDSITELIEQRDKEGNEQ